jgi:hypothetical protein
MSEVGLRREWEGKPTGQDENSRGRKLMSTALVLGCVLVFSLFTVIIQVKVAWPDYIARGEQLRLHQAVLAGKAGNPWQYRILPEYAVEAVIRLFTAIGVPKPVTLAFIGVRVVQNILLFLLAVAYYRRLGLNLATTLIGLTLLAYSMTHSLYDSDLQFNTYGDVTCYLAAGLIILTRRYVWIVPLMCVAALNRETSGLIPFLVFAEALALRARAPRHRKLLLMGGTALAVYVAIFVCLRLTYPPQDLITAYGNRPGLATLRFNLFRPQTWIQLFGTLGVLPFLAMASMRQWPAALRGFFWIVVPVWFLIHPFTSIMAESRLFLVPMALVFVPGALFAIASPLPNRRPEPERAISFAPLVGTVTER